MTAPDLVAIQRRVDAATPGPWCVESLGEKGDGCNVVGVAFGPDDDSCSKPLAGWLPPFAPDGMTEIEYYRDEQIAICDHNTRNAGYNAAFIAHARTDIPALLAKIAELEKREAEARKHVWGLLRNARYSEDKVTDWTVNAAQSWLVQ